MGPRLKATRHHVTVARHLDKPVGAELVVPAGRNVVGWQPGSRRLLVGSPAVPAAGPRGWWRSRFRGRHLAMVAWLLVQGGSLVVGARCGQDMAARRRLHFADVAAGEEEPGQAGAAGWAITGLIGAANPPRPSGSPGGPSVVARADQRQTFIRGLASSIAFIEPSGKWRAILTSTGGRLWRSGITLRTPPRVIEGWSSTNGRDPWHYRSGRFVAHAASMACRPGEGVL